jgi:arsenate reductase (glutaredoxin)
VGTVISGAMVTIWHNPNCSTSKHALDTAKHLGVAIDVRQYLKRPPSRDELVALLDALEDDPSALVRKDRRFAELGLTDADVATADQVADVLSANPALIQRPVLIDGDRAIIGRPKDRVGPFLQSD